MHPKKNICFFKLQLQLLYAAKSNAFKVEFFELFMGAEGSSP